MKKLKREANGTDLANKAKKNKTGIQKDEEPTESMKSTVSKLLVIRQSQNSIERTRAFLNKHRKRESKKLHQSQHFKQDANFKNSLTNNLSTVASDGMKLAESKSNEKVAICSINQETPSKQIHTLSDQTSTFFVHFK